MRVSRIAMSVAALSVWALPAFAGPHGKPIRPSKVHAIVPSAHGNPHTLLRPTGNPHTPSRPTGNPHMTSPKSHPTKPPKPTSVAQRIATHSQLESRLAPLVLGG